MQIWIVINLLLTGFFYFEPPASDAYQAEAIVFESSVVIHFGEQIIYHGRVDPTLDIEKIEIFIRPENGGASITGLAALTGEELLFIQDIEVDILPAFSDITYFFRVTLATGEIVESQDFSFYYEDNRFEWQEVSDPPFFVHWYEGDAAYAQSILDSAHQGMERATAILRSSEPTRVDIYAYANLEDYQFTKGQLGQLWAGGHTNPSAGLIVASLPPDATDTLIEIERKIPHEVGHLILYQASGVGFWELPNWLNEGFSSMIETFPNPDYTYLIEESSSNQSLIPIPELCDPFPRDASRALLSYAESTTFVQYIFRTYGSEGIRALVDSYSQGAGCESGTQVPPFNRNLSALETEWYENAYGIETEYTPENNILAWVAIVSAALAGPTLLASGLLLRRKTSRPLSQNAPV